MNSSKSSRELDSHLPLPLSQQPTLCSTCGKQHVAETVHGIEKSSISPELRRWMSRNPKNITKVENPDGSTLVMLNKTFGHMSSSLVNADGSVSVRCSTSLEKSTTEEEGVMK